MVVQDSFFLKEDISGLVTIKEILTISGKASSGNPTKGSKTEKS